MKRFQFAAALAVVAVVLSGPAALAGSDKRSEDLPERDEQHLSAELTSGATVEVMDISGTVDIQTTSGGPAQIDVVRSARNRKDLERLQVEVQSTPTHLLVRTKPGRNNSGWGDHEVRQHISLTVPRDVNVKISDISGNVDATEIAGSADVSDVSGTVTFGLVGEACTVSDVSGGVEMTVGRLGERGVRVSDVSGWVKLYFAGTIDANLHVSDVSGNVSVDLPNVAVQGRMNRDEYRATIGAGGPPVDVTDVSGEVRLAPSGSDR